MKSVIISMAMLFASFGASAQNGKLDEIFNKFQGKDGVTSVVITSDLIKFASEMDTKDSGMAALKNINQVRILSLEKAMAQDIVAFENMLKDVPLNNFKELMVVKENSNNVRMLAQDNQGSWSNFILIVTGGKDHALIHIQGTIAPKDLHALSKSMHVNGLACVNKLK
jgi:hypothetical protein